MPSVLAYPRRRKYSMALNIYIKERAYPYQLSPVKLFGRQDRIVGRYRKTSSLPAR